MTKTRLNNLRLFLKTLITAWVPIVVLGGLVSWDAQTSVLIMGASTVSVDGLFRVFDVGDAPSP